MDPDEFQEKILSRDIHVINKCIAEGYDTNSSYDRGCPCCPGDYDDMTIVLDDSRNIDIFKILLPLTDDFRIEDIATKTLSRGSEYFEFMDVIAERITIVPNLLKGAIECTYRFNYDHCSDSLRYISTTEDIYFEELDLTDRNYKLYKELIEKGQINANYALSSVFKKLFESMEHFDHLNDMNEAITENRKKNIDRSTNKIYDRFKNIIPDIYYMGELCMRLGASKSCTFNVYEYNNRWVNSILKKKILNPGESLEQFIISCEEALYVMKSISLVTDVYFSKIVVHLKEVSNIMYGILYGPENAITIQCAFRCYTSRKKVNLIRSQPDYLFEPLFSVIRKKKLNIDDSMFENV